MKLLNVMWTTVKYGPGFRSVCSAYEIPGVSLCSNIDQFCNSIQIVKLYCATNIHRNDKEHTNTWKNNVDICVAVVESIRLMALVHLHWWNTSIMGIRMN